MTEANKEYKNMVNMLRQGATLTEYSCPACSSPLFRLRSRDLWCVKCQKRVIVVKEGEKLNDVVPPSLFSELEITILTKMRELMGKIKEETNLERLQLLTDVLSKLLENLERLKNIGK